MVIAIIAALAALLFPALREALSRIKLAKCQSNQRQIFLALQAYANDHDRRIPLNDPHGGWGGMSASSGYYWNTYADSAGVNRRADGLPNRHVYRGLGQLWATRYLPREALLCADFFNETNSEVIWYRGRPNWRNMYTTPPAPPDLAAPGWSYGTYVLYSWNYRPGIRGGGPRRLGVEPRLTSGLVQCWINDLNPDFSVPRFGAHGRKKLNALFEDGHVTTITDTDQRQEKLAITQMRADVGNQNSLYGGAWWSSIIQGQ